ncbi:ANTAR domain-containing protein [Pseudonocardia alni]|uniref:ANTAR domain-containing protein n=1 Tax=Pseudonocardia alni TaxID=33907 RepID=UPI0033302018
MVEVLVEAAAVSLLRAAASERTAVETSQHRTALTSRVVVEQAKGMLAVHGSVDVGTAFACMRSHARRSGQPLRDLAAAVVRGDVDPAIILHVDR